MEPEPNYELYGVDKGDEQRLEILLEVGKMHRCVDQMKKMLQSIGESQDNLRLYDPKSNNQTPGKPNQQKCGRNNTHSECCQ